MIRYPSAAAKAYAFLKRPFNDVDIFVEDTTDRNMWNAIISKMLPAGLRFRSVTPVGGRHEVIKACRLDQADSNRKKLYIIDGDLDYVMCKRKPNLKYLYRLRAYCIENLLINKRSILDIGQITLPNCDDNEIEKRLSYDSWIKNLSNALSPLFIIYSISHSLSLDIKTIKRPVKDLFQNSPFGPFVCAKKAKILALNVARDIVKRVGFKIFFEKYKLYKSRIINLDFHKYVSGKDYIMPALHPVLHCRIDYKGRVEHLKVQLARAWQRSNEPWLHRTLQSL